MNILITGASGRLSRYMVPEFSDHDVLLMDIVPRDDDSDGVRFLQGDVTNFEDCRTAVAECEPQVIVALGALPWATDDVIARDRHIAMSGLAELPPLDTTMCVNVMGLYNLMRAAVDAKVETVIQTSSIVAVQPDGTYYPYFPADDRYPPCPTNSYNYSKIAGELMLQWFSRSFGIQTLCPRPAANWTPERCQQHAHEVQPATEWRQSLWHYVDTRDVARAHRQVFDARQSLPIHDSYLVHAADHQAIEDSRALIEKFRPDLLKSVSVYLSGRQSFYSCVKAHNAFGYEPQHSWTDYL